MIRILPPAVDVQAIVSGCPRVTSAVPPRDPPSGPRGLHAYLVFLRPRLGTASYLLGLVVDLVQHVTVRNKGYPAAIRQWPLSDRGGRLNISGLNITMWQKSSSQRASNTLQALIRLGEIVLGIVHYIPDAGV